MKKSQGFTLIEIILVMVLIGIIGATASAFFTRNEIFEQRFFLNDFEATLHLARKVAVTTNCEVQLGYLTDNELALFQRKECSDKNNLKQIEVNAQAIKIPRFIKLNKLFPIYIDNNGRVYDHLHQWHETYELQLNSTKVLIDGFSGFVYEAK